jgi:tetratricopeptide (TPR) repeat protein
MSLVSIKEAFTTLALCSSLLTFAVGGCRGTSSSFTIELEPTIISVSSEGEAIIYNTPAELFIEANELLRQGQHGEALSRYELFIEVFPEFHYVRTATYNSGLCYEGLDDWVNAENTYRTVVERWPASTDATDALFRWAEARNQLGNYEGVVPLMERVLRRAQLNHFDRVEAHVRLASAVLETRDYAQAEHHFREAVRLNSQAARQLRENTEPGDRPLEDFNPLMVQTFFGLGRSYHELFLSLKLVLPEDSIRQALVDKSQLFEQARLAYMDAVRAGHNYWSPAAGYMIGQIYEDFYLDILACEVPHHFNELTLEIYFQELRDYLDPLINRTLSIYEDNLSMSLRMRGDTIWIRETELGIERIQHYLFDESFREEQELEILQQRHPHGSQDVDRAWGGATPEEPQS